MVLGCSVASNTVMLAAWHPGIERSASARMLCRVSRTDSVSVSARAKSVSDSTRSPYRSPSCGTGGWSCATSAVRSDLGWEVPGSHLEVRGAPEAHAVRDATVPDVGLPRTAEGPRARGDGSAAGLISEHRWLLLPQVT